MLCILNTDKFMNVKIIIIGNSNLSQSFIKNYFNIFKIYSRLASSVEKLNISI